MKRKIKPQKAKKFRNPRSHIAREAWDRNGGIHSDQMANHKKSRQSSRGQLKDFGPGEWE
jgi:hypothetical protein